MAARVNIATASTHLTHAVGLLQPRYMMMTTTISLTMTMVMVLNMTMMILLLVFYSPVI